LGLGSSAAAVVAALGALEAARGVSLSDAAVRRRIFDKAAAAHAGVQGGGSGVDVAAAVYGGTLWCARHDGTLRVMRASLPPSLCVRVFWSGVPACTSELRDHVDAWKLREPSRYAARLAELSWYAHAIASACARRQAGSFVTEAIRFGESLARLGEEANAPIVPPDFAHLGAVAKNEHAAFYPAGAGGGDIGVYLGLLPPSPAFFGAAAERGFTRLDVRADRDGVRSLAPEELPRIVL
jgi:phosphomevalonate kinase